MSSFDSGDIYSEDSQNEINMATRNLRMLVSEKASISSNEINRKFGSFINNVIILLMVVDKSQVKIDFDKDSLESMQTYWTTISRMFIVYIPTIISKILSEHFSNLLEIEKSDEIIKRIADLDIVLRNCDFISDSVKNTITNLKKEFSVRKKLPIFKIIKKSLQETKLSMKQKNAYVKFFIGINTLRNHYAHFSERIDDENEKSAIEVGIDFVIKNQGGSNAVEIHPNDVFTIAKKIFDFLDEFNNVH